STSYTIASAAAGNAGTYTVVATNSAGTVTSSGAVLTVTAAPVITTQPVSQMVGAGSSVTFTVVAGGTPAPTYQWQFNGAAISGATSTSYTIASAAAGNAGTYTVVATNSAGTVTSSGAVLTVTAAPVITTQPVSQTVGAAASVTFTVVASGTPAPTYQWQFNGAAIFGATSASYTINSAAAGNAGTYRVVATNSAGTVTSSGAVLTVTAAPVITTQPVSQTVGAG